MEQAKLSPAMKIRASKDGLYAARRQTPGQEFFFFANSYRWESSRSRVEFKLGKAGLWRWNPETGERTPYDLPYDEEGFDIDLRPLESVLLVTGGKQAPKAVKKFPVEKAERYVVSTPWTVDFFPANSGTSFALTMHTLSDFSVSKDDRIRTFSGVAVYKTKFSVDDAPYTELDLGRDNDFISEVTLNGVQLGVNWYGSRLFDVSSVLKKGSNDLTIRYTTTLWNKMNSTQPKPSGLTGPVRLMR
jgi:hypothetical protein